MWLELQATFAGAIGNRLDSAVIEESTAIENYVFDTSRLGAIGDNFANRLGACCFGGAFASLFLNRIFKITG